MDVKLLNNVPETLDYAESLSYIKVDDYPSVLNEIQNIISLIKNLYPEVKDSDVEKLVNRASDYALALTRVISNNKIKK